MQIDSTADRAMQAYRLGAAACAICLEKPTDWKKKIRANIRAAKKLGIEIHPETFNNVFEEPKKR
jgi:hypothetical protein